MTDTKDKTPASTSDTTNDSEFNPEPCSSSSLTNVIDKSVSISVEAESTSSQLKPDKELLSQALQSMQHGKRHMIVSDYRSAVPCFEIACEFLGQCYGLRALECAEAYLNYGIALYEMSRLEEGLDGGIVNVNNQEDSGDDDDEDEEEDGDVNGEIDENKDKDNENQEAVESDDAKNSEEVTESNNKIDIDLMAQPSTSKSEPGSVLSSTEAANGDKSDEEEDNASNIEIAYEVLTTAKEIYSQYLENKDICLNYAEALQKLGEISIDWENPDGAIALLNECLEHRRKVLEPDDRLIAVTYHYLGLAYSFKLITSNSKLYDCETSNNCFQNALDVIQLRIDNLKAKDTTDMDIFEKASLVSEIEQLESLIPEIQLKIEDMKEQIQSGRRTMDKLENDSKQEKAKIEELLKDKPINNITHLIKRKREDVENDSTENGDNNVNALKKLCTSSNQITTTTTTTGTINPTTATNTSLVSSSTSSEEQHNKSATN